MTAASLEELDAIVQALAARLGALERENERLRESLDEARTRLAACEASAASGEPSEDDDSTDDMLDVGLGVRDIADPTVVTPDSALGFKKRRRSLDWTPELANVAQLYKFDAGNYSKEEAVRLDATRAEGTSATNPATVTLKLLAPDGGSPSQKYLVPLRKENGTGGADGIDLVWAPLGGEVSFPVGSDPSDDYEKPCTPDIEATPNTDGSLSVTVTNYKRGTNGECVEDGTKTTTMPAASVKMSCEDVRNCIDTEVTVLTGVTLSASGLVFSTKKVKVASATDGDAVSVGTESCEGS